MTVPVSTFYSSHFDYDRDRDTYTAELAELSHKVGTKMIARVITVCGRHFRIERVDRSGGDIAGWWYHEIGGSGKVLIIND